MKNNDVVECKMLILKYGVNMRDGIFNNVDREKFKLKKRVVTAKRVGDLKVYDISKDHNYIPAEILITNGEYTAITKLRYNKNSPLTITYQDEIIKMYNDNSKLNVELQLVEKNNILKEAIPGTNKTIGDYIGIVGMNRISVLLFDGCYNWCEGHPCKFCDLHPKEKDEKVTRLSLNTLHKYHTENEWWILQKEDMIKNIVYSLKRVLECFSKKECFIFFMAGNLSTSKMVWKIALEVLESISKEIDLTKYTNYLNIAPHNSIESLINAKKYGIKFVQYNIEVFNEEKFRNYCPGKLEYKKFRNKLQEAVTIMGKGKVRSNIVFGLENFQDTIKGAEEFAKEGIVVDYSVFQPKRGTALEKMEAPKFEEVDRFTKMLVEIYKQNDFEPIFSALSSRSSIINEIFENCEE